MQPARLDGPNAASVPVKALNTATTRPGLLDLGCSAPNAGTAAARAVSPASAHTVPTAPNELRIGRETFETFARRVLTGKSIFTPRD
jgi:hypothetical protein